MLSACGKHIFLLKISIFSDLLYLYPRYCGEEIGGKEGLAAAQRMDLRPFSKPFGFEIHIIHRTFCGKLFEISREISRLFAITSGKRDRFFHNSASVRTGKTVLIFHITAFSEKPWERIPKHDLYAD